MIARSIIGGLILVFFSSLAYSQPVKEIKSISFQYDHDALLEEFNQVNIGLQINFNNGKERETTGWLQGNYSWKNFLISTAQGSFADGVITFNRARVLKNHDKITVTVQAPGRNDLSRSFNIPVPRVIGIHFNLYSDSLKRDIEYDLNVQGIFDNGKSYPLDTSSLIFTASAGKLISNNVWLSLRDTAVHFIQVKAVYKLNPALTDSIIIPVKQMADTALLPSEESILKQYKKERRNKSAK